MYVW
jgi:maltose O-acetyltransferase